MNQYHAIDTTRYDITRMRSSYNIECSLPSMRHTHHCQHTLFLLLFLRLGDVVCATFFAVWYWVLGIVRGIGDGRCVCCGI